MTDPDVVGKTIRVNDVIVTVVGVIAPEFTGIQQPVSELPDIGLPLSLEPQLNTFGEARLGQPTYWWLQVMGRLKPGATAAQVQGNLEGVFQHTARAGLDSYMKGLTEAERGTAVNRTRTEVPRLRGGFRQPRDLRRQHDEPACGHYSRRRGGARSVDRLRERRESAALARGDPPEGTVRPAFARRHSIPLDPAAPDREPAARRGGWRARHPRRLLGQAVAARAYRSGAAARLARARVRAGGHGRHRDRLRHRAGARRHWRRRERRAQAEQPQRRRLAQPAGQIAAHRAGRHLARAARRRGAVSPDAPQSAARGRRVQPAEPAAVPRAAAVEPVRREAHVGALRPAARADRGGARRPRVRAHEPGAAHGQRQLDEHLRARARLRERARQRDQHQSSRRSRRTSSRSWRFRFSSAGASRRATTRRPRRSW